MKINKRLPDAEFEVMRVVWDMSQPVTSPSVLERIREKYRKDTKPQTVLTLLVRLENKGFLRSEKNGKEREYYYVVTENEYMQYETLSFMSKFRKGPISGLVNAVYNDKEINKDDIATLREWLDGEKL